MTDPGFDRRAYVEPEVDAARIDAGWDGVLARIGAGPNARRRGTAVAALGLAAAAALALVVSQGGWLGEDASSPWAGAVLESGEEPVRVTLNDGSAVGALPHARVVLLEEARGEVRLAVRAGSATFDVTRNRERRFVVVADDVEVWVLGTRFTVTREETAHGRRVRIAVERGEVEVRRGGVSHALRAGQAWSTEERLETSELAALEAGEPEADGPELAEPEPADSELAPVALDGDDQPERRRPRRPRATAESAVSAADLLARGALARRRGDDAGAAAAYQALLARYPDDTRASLAAFELGRLQMDRLGERRQAAAALERAVRLAPRSTFREDALGRLVRLYDGHEAAACARAKERYLESFPAGRYAQDVRARCGP
jgi:TolA-binding protein